MVERVNITPSRILLKDSSGSVRFNSDNKYIKTGGGTLYAGGYFRAPAIYGQGTENIVDHTDSGGYTSGLFGGPFRLAESWMYFTNVPKASSVRYRDLYNGWGPVDTEFVSPNNSNLYYYSYDTQTRSITGITFKWACNMFYAPGIGYKIYHYPKLSTYTLPEVTNPNGGTFELDYFANDYKNWERTVQVDDGQGGSYSQDQTANGQIEAYTNEMKSNGIFCTRPSVALSLAVTV